MPQISLKKILIVILAVIILAKLDKIIEFFSRIYQFFYDSFEPLRRCSPEWKYVITLAFLALIYITIFKLLLNRKSKK